MRTLIHKEAYRAARAALGVVVLAAMLLGLSMASSGNATMPRNPTDQLGAAALVTQIVALTFGWLAFRDDVDANAQLMTVTRPFSRRVVWSAKVGTWAGMALLSSVCILAPTTLLPSVLRAAGARGPGSTTPVIDPHLVTALALSWCGLLLVGAWIGQFGARDTWASRRGLPFLTKFAALLGPCSHLCSCALAARYRVCRGRPRPESTEQRAGETALGWECNLVTATAALRCLGAPPLRSVQSPTAAETPRSAGPRASLGHRPGTRRGRGRHPEIALMKGCQRA